MKLWLLGTGTPTPSVRRVCSGYLVAVGDDFLVFDHGFGAHHRLLELGVAATEVSHAFFSHHHYDHIGDYLLREICEIFKGDVFFGEDLMEIPFTSPSAAKLD